MWPFFVYFKIQAWFKKSCWAHEKNQNIKILSYKEIAHLDFLHLSLKTLARFLDGKVFELQCPLLELNILVF